jgi:hypothetical protein
MLSADPRPEPAGPGRAAIEENASMRERLERRLETLRAELVVGERALEDLERKEVALRNTILRISGAVQVLEEELAESGG